MKKFFNEKRKYILIVLVVVLVVVGGFLFKNYKSNPDQKANEAQVFTTIDSTDSLVFNEGIDASSGYSFVMSYDGVDLEELIIVPHFDHLNVEYKITYEKLHSTNGLGIEYYLAENTEFDFDYLDEFLVYYTSDKSGEEYGSNEEYDGYISDYKSYSNKNLGNKFSHVLVTIKPINYKGDVTINKIQINMESLVETEVVTNTIFEAGTVITFFAPTVSGEVPISKVSNVSTEFIDPTKNNATTQDFYIKANVDVDISNIYSSNDLANVSSIQIFDENGNVIGERSANLIKGRYYAIRVIYRQTTDSSYSAHSSMINLKIKTNESTFILSGHQQIAPSNFALLVQGNDYSVYANYFDYLEDKNTVNANTLIAGKIMEYKNIDMNSLKSKVEPSY